MQSIDLNCDMGEAFGNYPMPNDELLMDHITSANIACGFHAGDPDVMQRTVAMAVKKGVAIGAHPGLPDLQGFGRREMKIGAKEAYQITLYQIGALSGFVNAAHGKLAHVKPHGALYNMAAKDVGLAKAIAEAVHDFDPSLVLYGLANSEMITWAKQLGLKTASEVFADRTYQDDGSLTPRKQANALITDEAVSLKQVLMMVKQQQVISTNNKTVPLTAETLCLHGDGAQAVEFAALIRKKLKSEGIIIKAPGNP
ncbi:LamB/YcsF family protein [Mucilaginibacter myungsuensis]|uniref:5-oxoprolinase subunit A n=1 Tax=Mucilaginibacter myungsuensis TaxID=649104 RepID=A0A929KVS7_9SPHI|nr:5-oxoprolinase subunit PxpA [Mucilaginibacter myungsuensis]MBE9660803.1 LamB/YcsF family protein [Mucilaginibacter myungsuensis]MDN3600849.1 5-oxoprolinase subunit PxpA [Mucilaginibacter myungsuensis]